MAKPDLSAGISSVVKRKLEVLARHRERYVTAFCARYGVTVDDFDQWELVCRTVWNGNICTTHYWVQRREDSHGQA